jgi:hypothetical protein
MLRSYSNIANGHGGNASSVLNNRQEAYKNKLILHAGEINKFQSITDNAIMDYSPSLLSFVQKK